MFVSSVDSVHILRNGESYVLYDYEERVNRYVGSEFILACRVAAIGYYHLEKTIWAI